VIFTYDRFAESIDLKVADPVAHKHTPYVVILVKMAEEWAKAHGGALPSTRDEKKEFKVYNLVYKSTCNTLFLFLSVNAIYFGV
jgi:hypothetical protein